MTEQLANSGDGHSVAQEQSTESRVLEQSIRLDDFSASFDPDIEAQFVQMFGHERFASIKQSLTRAPSQSSIRVNTLQISTVDALPLLSEKLNDFNQRLARLGRAPVHPENHPVVPDVLLIKSASSLSDKKENTTCSIVIVDRRCGEAVLRGSDIYCPGILCASQGLQEGDEVNVLVDINDQCTRGTRVAAYNGKSVFIGKGIAAMSRGQIFRETSGLAIKVHSRCCGDAPPLNDLEGKYFYAQNLPSVIVALNLGPKKHETIIDLCAGPGGKTSHLAALMQGEGLLVAVERSGKRAQAILDTCRQLTAHNVVVVKRDSTKLVRAQGSIITSPQDIICEAARQAKKEVWNEQEQHRPLTLSGFDAETFDKVLLDPPCSAFGLRPRLAHTTTAKELAGYSRVQENLIWTAALLVKPGGTLVYSTCTFNPLENEHIVARALHRYPLKLVQQEFHIGDPGLTGQGLNDEATRLVQRFDPDNSRDTIGFFCAKFVKTASIRDSDSIAKFAADK